MYNKVLLIGHVGAEPRLRRPNGRPCATFHLATRRSWKDRDGERQEDTQWHPLLFWGAQAELAAEMVDKGHLMMVEGRLNHASWPDRDDPSLTHYRTEVVVEWFRVLSPKADAVDEAPSTVDHAGAPS